MQKVSFTHLLPYMSMPEQVQIDEPLVDIFDEDVVERLMGGISLIEPPEPPVDIASPLGFPEALVGGEKQSFSLSSITLSNSNNE